MAKDKINVELIPAIPKAHEIVTAFLTSFMTNINAADITWKIDGKTQKTGTGETKFQFTLSSINTTTNLEVTVITAEGETVVSEYSIKPADIDLIWQAKSFVPPFYKGKAIFSHQNEITFVAVPHIASGSGEIPAKNLIYKWSKDGRVLESDSGYGKNTLTMTGPIISRPFTIYVEVTTLNTPDKGFSFTNITPALPSIVFYKKDPLYGIEFQKALSGIIDMGNLSEMVIIAEPFFYGTTNAGASELTYKWTVNGTVVNSDPRQTVQVFRVKEGTYGTSNISLSIENSLKIFQYVSSNFKLKFGKSTTENVAF
ncbi:MAG: hypothetical protein WAX85_01850 [Minisyncoccia bacterium]